MAKSRKAVRPSELNIFKTKESGEVFTNCTDIDGARPTYNGRVNVPQNDPTPEHVDPLQQYQEVMRRLICRYIHHAKKQSRQDGVNEDDLLEIKQDISSLRFELREDRKREMVRTTGHMDNLRRDLRHTISSLSPVPPPTTPINGLSPKHGLYQTTFCGRTLYDGRGLLTPPQADGRSSLNTSHDGGDYNKFGNLTSLDLDCLRADILAGVRHEIREALQQTMAIGWKHQKSNGATISQQHLPSLPMHESNSLPLGQYNSDLYHTHLYTQL